VELTPESARYLVRLAPEITRKSNRTRRRFQRLLVANLTDALKTHRAPARSPDPPGPPGARRRKGGARTRVQDHWSRIRVEAPPDAMEAAARVFGVGSFSRIDATSPADLDAVVRTGHETYKDAVAGRRYAVAARRAGRHDFSSQDVREQLGAALNPYATVDLANPDVVVSVEVRPDEALFFAARTEGPGGLPLGVQGRAVCLLSGGFDSAAAAWLMLKRGVALDYVFCNLAGPAFERSVIRVAKALADRWSYGARPKIHVLPFGEAVEALRAGAAPRYWQVVLKRMMYRAAAQVAADTGARAIVTGESLGQVSSQTLANLRAIDPAAALPVLRPLIGCDKQEIIALATRIGTAALSARIKEYCAILEGKPVTAAKAAAVDREESGVRQTAVADAVAARAVMDLRSLRPADLGRDYVVVSDPPSGAVWIDCRLPHQDDGWRRPGSRRASPSEFAALAADLDKERAYVLFCDQGVHSTMLANALQIAGYDAYALEGGTRAARRFGSAEDATPQEGS